MSDTIRIPVGPSGKPVAWATIDFEDYERVIAYRWYANRYWYAFSPNAIDGKSVFLHGMIIGRLDEGDGLHIDHINRDRLDNRRENLRVVTVAENFANSVKGDRKIELWPQVFSLYEDGMPLFHIAAEVGTTVQTIRAWTVGLPKRPQKWTRERIIDAIQRFAEANGRPPVAREWIYTNYKLGYPPRSAIYSAGNAVFKSWADAVEAAGFSRPERGRYARPGRRYRAAA